jgi:hypothetical protein
MFGLTDKIIALAFGGLSAILLVVCAVMYVDAYGILWIKGLDDKLENCTRDLNEVRDELRKISSKKNEQQIITVEKIKQVETIRREADRVAEKIEHAPLPGNCKTPDAIMGADL